MHAVLVDNLDDHAIKADAAGEDGEREAGFDYVLSGYRLFRNFAVLVAAGHVSFPCDVAQAILTHSAADLREAFPEYFEIMDRRAVIVTLDEALEDENNDFSDTLLSYQDGEAVIRIVPGLDDDEEAEEAAAEGEATVDSGHACAECSDSPRTVEEWEQSFVESHVRTHGEPPSPAAEDYYHFCAKGMCGVALTDEEQQEATLLQQQVTYEAACRIAEQRRFERRRAAEIEADNAARCEVPSGVSCSTENVVSGMLAGFAQQLIDLAPDQLEGLKREQVVGVDYVAFGPSGGFHLTMGSGARVRLAPPLTFMGLVNEPTKDASSDDTFSLSDEEHRRYYNAGYRGD